MTELHDFVDGGMRDMSFLDSVSGIVNRGCHNPPCGTGPLDGGSERKKNFKKVLKEFGLKGSGGGNGNSWTGSSPSNPSWPRPSPALPSPVPAPVQVPIPPPPQSKPKFPSSAATYYSAELISRCGTDWMDANCGPSCSSNADCATGLSCWATVGCDDGRRKRGLRG